MLEDWERREKYRAAHPSEPRTPKQRERARARNRLARVQVKLEQHIDLLLIAHLDKSGLYHWHFPPLIPDCVWQGDDRKPGVGILMGRIKADADAGCDLSAGFLAKWQEAYDLCDYWRHQRPPARAANYRPQEPAAESDGDDPDWDEWELDDH